MVKEKRAMLFMHEDQMRKINKNNNVLEVIHSFLIDVANRVNHLLTAEEIDISLYTQDEIDRQQTVLYGINEEMGKRKSEIKSDPPVQVNNHCLQCSGNASYIKKAFKMACLTYASS